MGYYIKPPFDRKPKLITRIKGELVNLQGDEITEKIPATGKNPGQEITVRGATQADYKYLMSDDDPGDWSNIIGYKQATKGSNKAVAVSADK